MFCARDSLRLITLPCCYHTGHRQVCINQRSLVCVRKNYSSSVALQGGRTILVVKIASFIQPKLPPPRKEGDDEDDQERISLCWKDEVPEKSYAVRVRKKLLKEVKSSTEVVEFCCKKLNQESTKKRAYYSEFYPADTTAEFKYRFFDGMEAELVEEAVACAACIVIESSE